MGSSSCQRTRHVQVEEDVKRYHAVSEKLSQIQKLSERCPNTYKKMKEMINEMEIEAMKIIESNDENQ